MPTSGSGTMTPITSGAGVGTSLAQPLPYTLLSLWRFARLMGISPLHFARGSTPGLSPVVFPDTGCNDIWFKYDWQGVDKVSWMQLAETIQSVEMEVADVLGYWPAPMWTEEEYSVYPRPHRKEYYGLGYATRGIKSIKTKYGKLISGGRRAVSLVGTATVGGGSLVYSDEDSDGLFETATITLPTALTDEKEIKCYFSNHDGDLLWEVRDPFTKKISGGNVEIVYRSWQLIDPDLYEDYPIDGGLFAIDVSDTTNFVTTVDVYREYVDDTQASAQFIWEESCSICGGVSACTVCSPVTQDGCITIRDEKNGLVVPMPGSYSGGVWNGLSWTNGYEPSAVRLWYYSGALDRDYIAGRLHRHDPLSNDLAQIIAWITVARLERPLCSCSNVQAVFNELRVDMAISTPETSRFIVPDTMSCPFGTHYGEVRAWKKMKHFIHDKVMNVALI